MKAIRHNHKVQNNNLNNTQRKNSSKNSDSKVEKRRSFGERSTRFAGTYPYWSAGVALIAGTAVGVGLALAVRKLFFATRSSDNSLGEGSWSEEDTGYDTQFTGANPRGSGARSAVTGGSPEDMNGMPASFDPESEGPVYDGSKMRGVH